MKYTFKEKRLLLVCVSSTKFQSTLAIDPNLQMFALSNGHKTADDVTITLFKMDIFGVFNFIKTSINLNLWLEF